MVFLYIYTFRSTWTRGSKMTKIKKKWWSHVQKERSNCSVRTSILLWGLRFPELQQAVLAVCGNEVLVGVVGNADHILLMDLGEK